MAQTIKGLPKHLKKENTFKIVYYTNSYRDVAIKDNGKTIILTDDFGKDDVFKVETDINNVPLGYVVWNIGRHLFPIESYIPVCGLKSEYSIDTETLIALKVPSETVAQDILSKSIRNTMTVENIREYLTR